MNISHIMRKNMNFSQKKETYMNIKELRVKKGFRQEDLARELLVDRSAIAKWETGEAFPKANRLPKLAEVLSCTIEDLYDIHD